MSDLDRQLAEVLTFKPDADRAALAESVRQAEPLLNGAQLHDLVDRAWQRANGLGPIERLLGDAEITEVMVNGPGEVWLDRGGRLERSGLSLDGTEVALLIERILDPLGLRVDRMSPLVDARLADGSRVNIVVPPLAVEGPTITIRRFAPKTLGLDSFCPPSAIEHLHQLIVDRRNIVVSGGTGSGKTTLLNALGGLFEPAERIIVIEDTSELRLAGEHVVRLEARPANSEGVGAVSIRDLVRNSLRMRPDRLLLGEVRGGESFDLLMALNTGHTGSLSTCHANSPAGALQRLLHLALLSGVDLPVAVVEAQIGLGVDAVVQTERNGHRRFVRSIAEVLPDGRTVRSLWEEPDQ